MATSTINYLPKVVESGTSDMWTYRKWSDGTAECWGRWAQHFGAFSANGAFYESGYTAKNYPSGLFTATPTLQYTFDECYANLIPVAYSSGSAVATPQLWALSGKALAEADTKIVLRAIGKWR